MAAIKRVQQWQCYDTATIGNIEERSPELICCPEVDYNRNGEPNLPLKSCQTRQQDPKMRKCFGGCTAKLPPTHKPVSNNLAKYGEQRSAKFKVNIDKIIMLYSEGKTTTEIATIMNRTVDGVRRILTKAGVYRSPRDHSIKNKVRKHMGENPHTTPPELVEIFGCTIKTARTYHSDWRQGEL